MATISKFSLDWLPTESGPSDISETISLENILLKLLQGHGRKKLDELLKLMNDVLGTLNVGNLDKEKLLQIVQDLNKKGKVVAEGEGEQAAVSLPTPA